jgi:hypothetical protein
MLFSPFSEARAMLLDPFHPLAIQMVVFTTLVAAVLALGSGA